MPGTKSVVAASAFELDDHVARAIDHEYVVVQSPCHHVCPCAAVQGIDAAEAGEMVASSGTGEGIHRVVAEEKPATVGEA